MSLLSNLKAAVGVGGARVEIVELAGQDYYWTETVRGALTLTGGQAEQTVDNLTARLACHSIGTDSHGQPYDNYDRFSETSIAIGLTVTPSSSQQFPFEVVVPDIASPTGTDYKLQPVTWFVEGMAYIHHAIDASGGAVITVHCPATLEALASAIEQVAPVAQRMKYNTDAFMRSQPIIHFQFAPTDEGKASLDGVKLDVEERDGQVIGTLEINPQEHSRADHLRALVLKDRVHHAVSFPAAALFAGEDGSVGREVLAQLDEWFRPYLPAAR